MALLQMRCSYKHYIMSLNHSKHNTLKMKLGGKKKSKRERAGHPHICTIQTQTSIQRRQASPHASCRAFQCSIWLSIKKKETKRSSHMYPWDAKTFYSQQISCQYITGALDKIHKSEYSIDWLFLANVLLWLCTYIKMYLITQLLKAD